MKENQLNTIINNSIKTKGFSHKIADPRGGSGIQNPFDGFSVMGEQNIYFESKLLKPLKSFNFNSIEEHQEKNLNLIKQHNKENICLYFVGAFEPRKYLYIFVLDSELISFLKKEGKNSILKKEFTSIIEYNKMIIVEKIKGKYFFDPSFIFEKRVTVSYWREIFSA